MLVRSAQEPSVHVLRLLAPVRLALRLCGAALLLAGAGEPLWAQAPANPPYYSRHAQYHPGPGPYFTGVPVPAPAEDPTPPTPEPAAPTTGKSTAVLQPTALVEPAAADNADDSVPVFPIQLRPPKRGTYPEGDDAEEGMTQFHIQLQPPGPQRLFRRESEPSFQERIRQETPRRPYEPVQFPKEPVLATSPEEPVRQWQSRVCLAEPNYVCYGPLFYEQKYAERYGWDFGLVSPILAAGRFYYDLAASPYYLLTSPCHECSAGYCLPGDPTPLRLDPPKWPITIEINVGAAKR